MSKSWTALVMAAAFSAAFIQMPVSVQAQCGRWLAGDPVSGIDGPVLASVLLPGGDVVMAGNFSVAGAVPASSIVRYRPSTNEFFPMGVGGVSPVLGYLARTPAIRALLLLPDGSLLASGDFLSIDGVAASGIARYSFQSNTWSALGSGLVYTGGPFPSVRSLTTLPDGQVLVAGQFSRAGGISSPGLARYDLTTGAWSPLPGSSTIFEVASTHVLPDGDILISGYAGSDGFARYDSETGIVTTDSRVPRWVYTYMNMPSGKVLVGGSFQNIDGVAGARSVALYDPATNTWSRYGTGFADNEVVYQFNLRSDGRILAATSEGLRVYTPATGAWTFIQQLTSGTFASLAEVAPGEFVVMGTFSAVGAPSVRARNIAGFDLNNGVWSRTSSGRTGTGFAMARVPNSLDTVYVVGPYGDDPLGTFNTFNSTSGAWSRAGTIPYIQNIFCMQPTSGIAGQPTDVWIGGVNPTLSRVDVQQDTFTPVNLAASASVHALAWLPDGDLLIGGHFFMTTPVVAQHIVRYRPSTGTFHSVGAGASTSVRTLVMTPSGDIFVGGFFASIGGVNAQGAALYNPNTGAWTSIAGQSGVPGTVFAATLLHNGDVVTVGSAGVYQYKAVTRTWQRLTSVNGDRIAALPSGDLVVSRSAIGGAPYHMYKYSFADKAVSSLNGGVVNGEITSMVMLPSGTLVVGGLFTAAGPYVSASVARYVVRTTCRADVDCSNAVTVDDIFVYINAWFADCQGQSGSPCFEQTVDVTGDGLRSIDDIFVFLNIWFAGC